MDDKRKRRWYKLLWMIPVWYVLNLWLLVIASIGVAWYKSRHPERILMPVTMLVFLVAFFTWLVFVLSLYSSSDSDDLASAICSLP